MMANANAYVSRGDSLLGTGEWPLARGRTADDQAGRVCVCIVYFVLKETRNKQESCAGEAKSGMEKIRWGFVAAHLLRLVGSGPVGVRSGLSSSELGTSRCRFTRKYRTG